VSVPKYQTLYSTRKRRIIPDVPGWY